MDTHFNQGAKQQPEMYDAITDQLEAFINVLRDTPYDDAQALSFMDVTTFLISSEFSRTMRQNGLSMEDTGTDHNTLGNSLIIGGKGINTGAVIGSTDLDRLDNRGEFSMIAPAHKQMDAGLLKTMGRPYDFVVQQSMLEDAINAYEPESYISMASVANTIMKQFNVSEGFWRKASNIVGSLPAKTLNSILK